MTSTEVLDNVESILEDINGLIECHLDAGDDQYAYALVEEFKEWFLEYDLGKEVHITTLKIKSDVKKPKLSNFF